MRRRRGPPLPVITPRQRDILALILQGEADKEIAYRLGLPCASVKACNSQLYRRIGVRNRVEAALWGVRHPEHLAPPAKDVYQIPIGV